MHVSMHCRSLFPMLLPELARSKEVATDISTATQDRLESMTMMQEDMPRGALKWGQHMGRPYRNRDNNQ